MNDYSYLGSGNILIREYGASEPFAYVGNCSALSFSPQVNNLTLQDYTRPGGGTRNRVDRVTSVDTSYTFHDFAGENFARALRGSVSDIAGGTATEEPVVAYLGGYTPLFYIAEEIMEVTSPDGMTTYQSGTDYAFVDGGISLPETSAIPAPVNGEPNLAITYTYVPAQRIEAFVNSAKQYEMLFIGLNEARSGKPVRVSVHKVSGGVMEQFGLIGDEYGQGTVTGAVLADTTRPIGLSQYFTADIVK